jgi:hypothetical protein
LPLRHRKGLLIGEAASVASLAKLT